MTNDDALVDGRDAHDLHERGLSWTEVATELGCSIDTVRLLANHYLAHVQACARQQQIALF